MFSWMVERSYCSYMFSVFSPHTPVCAPAALRLCRTAVDPPQSPLCRATPPRADDLPPETQTNTDWLSKLDIGHLEQQSTAKVAQLVVR